jgi:hypothetical protein
LSVWPWPNRRANFRGENDVVAVGKIANRAPEHRFALAARVVVGRVEEIDAQIEGPLEERPALLFAQSPRVVAAGRRAGLGRTVAHAAETNARHLKSGLA